MPTQRNKTSNKQIKSGIVARQNNKSPSVAIPAAYGQTHVTKAQGNRAMRFSNREIFDRSQAGPVLINGAYNNVNYWTINPGNSAMFPWLSRIAKSFEKYKFHSLSFSFVTRRATGDTGTHIMAVDPDPDDLPSEAVFNNPDLAAIRALTIHPGAVDANVWMPASMQVPRSVLARAPFYYVRDLSDGDVTVEPRSADIGLYFDGVFGFSGTSGANSFMGELVVSYDVELMEPSEDYGINSDFHTTFSTTNSSTAGGTLRGVFDADHPFSAVTNSTNTDVVEEAVGDHVFDFVAGKGLKAIKSLNADACIVLDWSGPSSYEEPVPSTNYTIECSRDNGATWFTYGGTSIVSQDWYETIYNSLSKSFRKIMNVTLSLVEGEIMRLSATGLATIFGGYTLMTIANQHTPLLRGTEARVYKLNKKTDTYECSSPLRGSVVLSSPPGSIPLCKDRWSI